MFEPTVNRSSLGSALRTAELVYVSTVRSIRKTHGNAVMSLFLAIVQVVLMLALFYFMLTLFGARGMALRGDFVLFLMSGIFIFLTHNQAVSAVLKSEGPTSAMMLHGPMTTAIAIGSAALGTLYTQTLAMILVLIVYHIGWQPVTIEQPAYAMGMVILGWLSGCAVGLVFLALKPWFPRFVDIVNMIYRRLNMIASGKMFTANALPSTMVAMFDWNPIFHCIDQARGFVFINYYPHVTSIAYPIYLTLALTMLGMMGEYYARKNLSLSYSAGQ